MPILCTDEGLYDNLHNPLLKIFCVCLDVLALDADYKNRENANTSLPRPLKFEE
jgi:hypothetical protein